jgi:hypothetical protein
MKHTCLSIVFIIVSLSSFAQNIEVSGFDANGMPGKRYTFKPTYYQHPLYSYDDSTAAFDSGRYYISSLGRNATKDSIILTLLNGTRFSVKDSSGGGGSSVTSGTLSAMLAVSNPADGAQYSITDYLPGPYQYSKFDSTWRYLTAPDVTTGPANSPPYLQTIASGSGSSVSNTGGFTTSLNSRYGFYRFFQTGTTASGSAGATLNMSTVTGGFGIFPEDTVRAAIRIQIMPAVLSNSTDRFLLTVGRYRASGSAISGVYFQYCDSINSGNWQCVFDKAGTQVVVNTSISPSTTRMQDFVILINKTNLSFYINKSLVGSITASAYTTTQPIIDGFSILKTVGTTNVFAYFSSLKLWVYNKD